MALAKNMSEQIDSADMQRSWGKVKSGPKKRKATSAIDSLSPEQQAEVVASTAAEMISETLAEVKPAPPEAEAEFPRILHEINSSGEPTDYEDVEESEEDLDAEYQDYGQESTLPLWLAAKDERHNRATQLEARPETQPEPLAEPAELRVADDNDDGYDEEDDLPEFTEEILAKMFANMRLHGRI
jgi:hypothetical protein